ncbi:MAG TPA: hypothetical protein VFS20_21495 [Longimicrobium sp.]|nr:hypothetical protein [Longimicrobium sp.]
MTTKKRRFIRRGLLLVLGVGLAATAWHFVARWFELRDFRGKWAGWAVRITPAGAVLPWNATVTLWKSPSGGWAGTFLYRDGWRGDRVCVGRLAQQSSSGEGILFTETESNCPAGQLRVRRSERFRVAVSRSGAGEDGPGAFESELNGGVRGGERELHLADTATHRAPRRPWQIIRPGQTVRGAIAPGDQVSSQWGEFDTFLYAGPPGVPVVLRVAADSVVLNLEWGAMIGEHWVSAYGDQTDIETEAATRNWQDEVVAVTPRRLGDQYGFRLLPGGGRNGSYTVTVEPGPHPARMIDWLPRLEREGEVRGRLQEGDSLLAPPEEWVGNTQLSPLHYDTYAFFAAAEERLTFTMRSAELAPVLWIGVVVQGQFVPLKSSTTTGAGEAVLHFIPSEPGDYVVRAGSLAPGKEGAYTIRTKDAFPDAAPGR